MKYKKTLLISIVVLFGMHCTREQSAPELETGKVYSQTEMIQEDREKLLQLTELLIQCIFQNDLKPIVEHVHPERGVFVDLKAIRSKNEFEKQVFENDPYFQKFYFDGELLRQQTQDPEQLSVKELLSGTETVIVDFFMERGGKQAEITLNLKDTPDQNFRLNNLVFIQINNRWYFYQLL